MPIVSLATDDETVRLTSQLVPHGDSCEMVVESPTDEPSRIPDELVDDQLSRPRVSNSGAEKDELSVKPIESAARRTLACETINRARASSSYRRASVTPILSNELNAIILPRTKRGDQDQDLTWLFLSLKDSAGHLRNCSSDLVNCLRFSSTAETHISLAARLHGDLRRRQGCPALMTRVVANPGGHDTSMRSRL